MIDDCDKVIAECYRILKPGGSLLITSSCISPQIDYELSYWRFTIKSLEFILRKQFKHVKTTAYGNAYIGQALWVGMVQEDINKSFLDIYDKQFQCITAAVATK
jgi:ubiquinone/menaquinone biosynthesis C-methylase UbiE